MLIAVNVHLAFDSFRGNFKQTLEQKVPAIARFRSKVAELCCVSEADEILLSLLFYPLNLIDG